MSSYPFRWSRPPQLREYVWPIVATLQAVGLSFAGLVALFDPAQYSGDPMDQYAMWIIAPLSWLIPFFFWSMLAIKRQQFRDRLPVLVVDDRGISTRDWRGKLLVFLWSEVTFERVQRGANDDMLFRAGKVSGSISLKDLDRNPGEITDIMNKCSMHAT
jgi:hypothetical protein